jgi:hypothetical protein
MLRGACVADLHLGWAGDARSFFSRVVSDVCAKSRIPIYLPPVLPRNGPIDDWSSSLTNQQTMDIRSRSTSAANYGRNNATYNGMVSGFAAPEETLPDDIAVRLNSGAVAQFIPIRCGGSCVPANLWWQANSMSLGECKGAGDA